MDPKVVNTSDWFRKLAERVGLGERDHALPDWVREELLTASDEEMSEKGLTIADIPAALKRRLQAEALQRTFHRLEAPLRFLLYATVPGNEPGEIQEYRHILNIWRQGLEQEAMLVPDAYQGAVIPYEPTLETAYHINGRCEPGDPVLVSIPAWRIQGVVVVRGEAEPHPADECAPPVAPEQSAAPDAEEPREPNAEAPPREEDAEAPPPAMEEPDKELCYAGAGERSRTAGAAAG